MQHIQKYGSAFLNSDGGTLCVGVSDEGYAHMHIHVLYTCMLQRPVDLLDIPRQPTC